MSSRKKEKLLLSMGKAPQERSEQALIPFLAE